MRIKKAAIMLNDPNLRKKLCLSQRKNTLFIIFIAKIVRL